MDTGSIRLGVVEPHALYRDLMVTAFSSQADIEVILAVGGIGDLPSNAGVSDVQVLLLSLSFNGTLVQPAELVEIWRRVFPDARTLVLSKSRVYTTITALLRAGIDGYLICDAIGLADLTEGVRSVHAGSMVICPAAQDILYRDSFYAPRLTAMELEVVRSLTVAHEYSRKEAANLLNMCYKTFNVHMRNIATKLDIYGGSQSVVTRCREIGLI